MRRPLHSGLLFALAAGLLWGLVFVAPLWLADYPPLMLTLGRYLAFGLLALPLALADRRGLAQLERADWWAAMRLSLIGNFLYYLCLSAALQSAGAALPTVLIGCLPVVIAISANLGAPSHRLPWLKLLPALAVLALGLACVNHVELQGLTQATERTRYVQGALLAVAAVACWTWYPLRNATWLRAHTHINPRVWATAQGLVTLPLALLLLALMAALQGLGWSLLPGGSALSLGARPWAYVGAMLTIGLLSSWLGTLCWNAASQRLPATLLGPLIVFETLAALAYAYGLSQQWPAALTLLGVGLLVTGVVLALKIRPVAAGA